ncbi:MAG: transketolase [Anaerolineae bacterium]|nr:transketolase [Anaerolineae bacterium]
MPKTALDQRCINTLRILAMDAVQQANSGHPGMPMGMADVAYTLWTRHLKHNPRNPGWPNRDRFILSAGHGAMLLYGLLYLTGYPLTLKELKQFRQWESHTPGHPEYALNLGVEATTGLPGQGFANAVGMSIAYKHNAARFNRPGYTLLEHYVYAIVSDGDLMGGLSHETASLAGHLGLENLVCFYDNNGVSAEGRNTLTFTEDVPARFRAYNWHIQSIDGHDLDAIDLAIRAAKRAAGQPHLIICRTHLAYGSPNQQDNPLAHGAPLGEEEGRLTKDAMGWPSHEPFFVPDDVVAYFRLAIPQGERIEARWRDMLTQYEHEFPDLMREFARTRQRVLPDGWETAIPRFRPDEAALATRTASGKILNSLADVIPELLGGAADAAPSTKTYLNQCDDFQKQTPLGRNLRFGVREHAMGGILNGLALYGGLRVYGATLLAFADFMRPAIRLAAMMKLPVIYVWTHDSFYAGEDGPTHQPVEHLMALRLLPGITVIRPADANETAAAWRFAINNPPGPVALVLTSQPLPILPEAAEKAWDGVSRGAYILSDSPLDRVDIILIATGSEVSDAIQAQSLLVQRRIGARIVSMPSWELFEQQPLFYKLSVLPHNVIKRLSIEAGTTHGWRRYVGNYGDSIGLDRFGASAPYPVLKDTFGFTPAAIAERAIKLMAE